MKRKQGLLTILVMIILISSRPISASGKSVTDLPPIDTVVKESDKHYIPTFINNTSIYRVARGKVVTIEYDNNKMYLTIVNSEGLPATLLVSSGTYLIGNVQEGDFVAGYYDSRLPMLYIYPPLITVEVLVVENEDTNVYVGGFNSDLLSSDSIFRLKDIDTVEIVYKDGELYNGSIIGRKLVVLYNTESKYPPKEITPTKIVMLGWSDNSNEIEKLDIRVNTTVLSNPKAYLKDGVVMLPLRAISDLLDYKITWDSRKRTVYIGGDIIVTMLETPIILKNNNLVPFDIVPKILNETLYVPLDFFTEVLDVTLADVGSEINIVK